MKVKIKSKVGTHAIVTNINGTDYVTKFEEPDFIALVPTEITYKDAFGKQVVYHRNYAQHLLNVYPELELVSEVPEPAVVPKIVEKPVEREIQQIKVDPKDEPTIVNTPKVAVKKTKVKEKKNETNN